ncbi:MAG: transglutaminase domain-containing protein [Caldilineaceae bacterium]
MAASALNAREAPHWFARLMGWIDLSFRPTLGWGVFVAGLILAFLPAAGVRSARWINMRSSGVALEWVGPVALLVVWLLYSAVARVGKRRGRFVTGFFAGFALFWWLLLGLAVLTQVIVDWLPGLAALRQAVASGNWQPVADGIAADWLSLVWRFGEWQRGILAGGAHQDDLVFLWLVGAVIWLAVSATAWLLLRTHNGLVGSLPALWLLGTIQFYGSGERLPMAVGLAVALILHFWLDHRSLEASWQARRIDYSPGLLLDRTVVSLGLVGLVLLVGLLIPPVSVNWLAWQVYEVMQPVYQPMEDLGEQMFPELQRRSGLRFGRIGSGLPNRFLLDGGAELSQIVVMKVSTNEGGSGGPDVTPPRVYLRKATFSIYDGSGWENPPALERQPEDANSDWQPVAAGETPRQGRKELIQRITTSSPTALLYAAGEPKAVLTDYSVQVRSPDDLVALWVQAAPVTRYDVVSSVPAVSEQTLQNTQSWSEGRPLPPELAVHLALPDTVTDRTRQLAAELAEGRTSSYDIAAAIEGYLRGYPYDLDVPGPPEGVDVADFFLFDLARGYCDYYATAFATLARLNGLPTRFATGYISSFWDWETGEWTITEAEAHSWPEVYFPDLGWIPFEPTAGRPALQRTGLPSIESRPFVPAPLEPEIIDEVATDGWNWQMLFWLLPVIGLLWALLSWLDKRDPDDPWVALIAWGRRLGRGPTQTETELEYGRELAEHLNEHPADEAERQRRIIGNVLGLSQAVSESRYATGQFSALAARRATARWKAIRKEISRWKR